MSYPVFLAIKSFRDISYLVSVSFDYLDHTGDQIFRVMQISNLRDSRYDRSRFVLPSGFNYRIMRRGKERERERWEMHGLFIASTPEEHRGLNRSIERIVDKEASFLADESRPFHRG